MKKLLVLFLGLILIVACKKDEVAVEKTTLEYLTGISFKKWIINAGVVKDGNLSINLIANQPTCITDNIFVLHNDNSFELIEGASKCDPSKDPDVIMKGIWGSTEDPKTITIERFFFLGYILENSKFFISSIGEDKFIGTTEVKLNGKSYQAELTFTEVK